MLSGLKPEGWLCLGPLIVLLSIHLAIFGWGVYILQANLTVLEEKCFHTFHLGKMCWVNIVYYYCVVVTYFGWKGGGEGARARALMLLIVHGALFAWACLMMQKLEENHKDCYDAFKTDGKQLLFMHFCAVSNVIFCGLYTFHEVYLGHKTEVDWTLWPEFLFDPADVCEWDAKQSADFGSDGGPTTGSSTAQPERGPPTVNYASAAQVNYSMVQDPDPHAPPHHKPVATSPPEQPVGGSPSELKPPETYAETEA